MSVQVLEASKLALETDIHNLKEKLDALKTLPLVKLSPDGVIFLSVLIHILRDCETEIKQAMAISQGKRVYPLPVMRARLDVQDHALSLLEQLVLSLERSVDVPAELYFMLREVFHDFKCDVRFVILYYSQLATSSIEGLIPSIPFPETVNERLGNFAIILVPPRFAKNPEYWPRIVHEAAHNIDHVKGITDNSIRRFRSAQMSDEIRQSAESLCRERVADLLSTHYYGPAYGESALLVFLRGEPMSLPSHPVGTHRLLTVASELKHMGFEEASHSLVARMRQLGIYEKIRDQFLDPVDVNKSVQTLLRKNARKTSAKSHSVIALRDVKRGVRHVSELVEFDLGKGKFVRLTPTNMSLRLLFNSYKLKFKGRFENDFEASQDLQGWILDSIRLRISDRDPAFEQFYARSATQTL